MKMYRRKCHQFTWVSVSVQCTVVHAISSRIVRLLFVLFVSVSYLCMSITSSFIHPTNGDNSQNMDLVHSSTWARIVFSFTSHFISHRVFAIYFGIVFVYRQPTHTVMHATAPMACVYVCKYCLCELSSSCLRRCVRIAIWHLRRVRLDWGSNFYWLK